jgi:hypothetical protein
MVDPEAFTGAVLHGGFTIVRVEISGEPMVDAIGREPLLELELSAAGSTSPFALG